MFTVKQTTLTGEMLYLTHAVSFFREPEKQTTVDHCRFVTSHGFEIEISEGSVFVMNENGRTVEQYHFMPK